MQWPEWHPAVSDDALAPWSAGADELCPEGEVGVVLRHVRGRRVATHVRVDGRDAVLKVFANPRARGNHRRLSMVAAGPAASVVPAPLGADRSGHVSLVGYTEGTTYDELDDAGFVGAAFAIGGALRSLHESAAVFDRCWTYHDEVRQLRSRVPDTLAAVVERTVRATEHLAEEGYVSAHRDFHPRQVVVHDGRVQLIDLDDAANAPAGLDVGNFTAHVRCEAVKGRRTPQVCQAAVERFLEGYGALEPDVERGIDGWETLSMVRLAELATNRHARPDWTAAIKDMLGR